MDFLKPIIGSPAVRIMPSGDDCAAVLTEKGFAVCDPAALETGSPPPDCGDDSERCELRRGHAHIRVRTPSGTPSKRKAPDPCWGLHLTSGWVVILPFQDLPEKSREVISRSLPEGFLVPPASVKPLQHVREAHKADMRRQLRLKDALADAGYLSPLTLQPTGLHSIPLRVYARNQLRPLPLPEGHKLSAILTNWSGKEEFVEFENWPARPADWN